MKNNNDDISHQLEEVKEILTMLVAKIEKQKKQAFQEGIKKGMYKKAQQIAKALLKENMTIEKISSITDLPIENIKRVKSK